MTILAALLATTAWRDVEKSLRATMTELFQLPFVTSEMPARRSELFVAEVALSEPAQELELGLSVVVDVDTMRGLSAHLLGDDGLEEAQALMLEVANMLMGTLKTELGTAGFAFTGGIPSAASYDATFAKLASCNVQSRVVVTADGHDLELWLSVREKRKWATRGRLLREGLVLGDDIHDENGKLVMRSGSRLTQTSATQLALAMPDLVITVSDLT